MPRVEIGRFPNGVNLRDNPADLGLDEAPYLLNYHVSPNGLLYSRSLHRLCSTVAAGIPKRCYYSSAIAQLIVQVGTKLYRFTVSTSTGAGSSETLLHTFTTDAHASFADFNGTMVMVHPVDGVYDVSAAFSVTSRSTTVKGTSIAVWQNKVWVGGDSSNKTRVWWSNAGDATTWTTASDFVDLRDVDDETITALYASGSMDNQGRPGLLVFKRNSHYRIYESSTGAYTTLDASSGAIGAQCVDALNGMVGFLDPQGFYISDGVSKPTKVSSAIDPAITNVALTTATQQSSWVKAWRGKFVFCAGTADDENVWFEWNPVGGAIGMFGHQKDAGVWPYPVSVTRLAGFDELLFVDEVEAKIGWFASYYFNSQNAYETTAGMWTTIWTPFVTFDAANPVRVHRVIVQGRSGTGDFSFYALKDWSLTEVARTAFELTSTADVGGIAHDARDFGVCRSLSVGLRVSTALADNTVGFPNFIEESLDPTLDAGSKVSRGQDPAISRIVFEYDRLDGYR